MDRFSAGQAGKGGGMHAELKILLGCTADETQTILAVHRKGTQAAMLISRPEGC